MQPVIVDPKKLEKLVVVRYPAAVKDEEKAIRCLGGMENINKALSGKTMRRLELRFRPDDVYCKPTCSEPKKEFGFLMRITVRRHKRNPAAPPRVIASEPIGVFKNIYKFNSLCDFQCLPVDDSGGGIHNQVVPGSILDESYFSQECPLFVPPVLFTRMDKPQEYCYRRPPQERRQHEQPQQRSPSHSLGPRGRLRLSEHKVSHLVSEVPGALCATYRRLQQHVRRRLLLQEQRTLEQMFAARPVASRAYIMFTTGLSTERLRLLLPVCAYYFISGPWHNMWVRRGYDPRAHQHAAHYQIVDYRCRYVGQKSARYVRHSYPSASASLRGRTTNTTSSEYREAPFRFRPGMLPVARQTFYQYCEIELPEVQQAVRHGLLREYNEESGWLADGVDEMTRSAITQHTSVMLDKGPAHDDKEVCASADVHNEDGEDEEQLAAAESGFPEHETDVTVEIVEGVDDEELIQFADNCVIDNANILD